MTDQIHIELHGPKFGLNARNQLVLQNPDTGLQYAITPVPTRDVSPTDGRVVNVTGATLNVTEALHDGKIITLNHAGGIAVTLPTATGSGDKFDFIVGTTFTSSATIKVNNSTDAFQGFSQVISDDGTGGPIKGFAPGATDDTITLNGTTTGGYAGDHIVITDIAAGKFQVEIRGKATGTEATPFSSTV